MVPCWPTRSRAAVSVPSAHGGWLSREIITLLAPSPLNQPILSVSVFSLGSVSAGLQSLSTNELIKHQLNGNSQAALSMNVVFKLYKPNTVRDSMHTQMFHLFQAISVIRVYCVAVHQTLHRCFILSRRDRCQLFLCTCYVTQTSKPKCCLVCFEIHRSAVSFANHSSPTFKT